MYAVHYGVGQNSAQYHDSINRDFVARNLQLFVQKFQTPPTFLTADVAGCTASSRAAEQWVQDWHCSSDDWWVMQTVKPHKLCQSS